MVMFERPFWMARIEQAWRRRPIVWLSGVRRSGKTTLCRMAPNTEYVNCDLPSERKRMADHEQFLKSFAPESRIVLDEIHRLEDPSQLLKICADEFPRLRILATGSSTLSAIRKFRDSLTGRKTVVTLPPVLWNESVAQAGISDLSCRMLHGGLPQPLLEKSLDRQFFSEWLDSFYARDIEELFRVRNRRGFIAAFRILLHQSGSALDYSTISREIGVSRPTLMSYVDMLSICHAVSLVPPYSNSSRKEIVKQPRCYAFDTGFVCHERGWETIRDDDKGTLWEHLVLDGLKTAFGPDSVYYWRKKNGEEIDWVVKQSSKNILAIECKINPDKFSPKNMVSFRSENPFGENWVLSPAVVKEYQRTFGSLIVKFLPFQALF